MIELSLVGVRVELPSNQPIVLLKESQGDRYLPIWIGAVEATAIAFALQGVQTPRPMTHDLLRDIMNETHIQVERVLINDLVDSTFFALIRMSLDGRTAEVSSRPSDAIALAVRIDAPIFAAEEVLEQAGIELKDEEETEVQKFREFLDQVSPEDFATGQWPLKGLSPLQPSSGVVDMAEGCPYAYQARNYGCVTRVRRPRCESLIDPGRRKDR
jgi:bifunctional DNase/RNase